MLSEHMIHPGSCGHTEQSLLSAVSNGSKFVLSRKEKSIREVNITSVMSQTHLPENGGIHWFDSRLMKANVSEEATSSKLKAD